MKTHLWRAWPLLLLGLVTIAGLRPSGPASRAMQPQDEGPWVVRAYYEDRAQVNELAAWLPPWEVHPDEQYIVVGVGRAEYERLQDLGFRLEIDWVLTARLRQPRTRLPGQDTGIAGFPCYRTVEETFATAQALAVALTVGGAALGQGLTGLGRNVAVEFMAQLFERNSREELYASLLGKSQTFHGRRRVGDIMARATGDVRALNAMISPGVMLILDSALALVMPLVMIGLLDPRLLLVPGIFTVLLVVTVWDYNRRLQPVSIAQRDQYGVMSADLTETIAGIEVVKANVREHYEWKIAYPVDTG